MPRRVAGGTAIITAATIIRSTTITATTITPGTTITTVTATGIANPGYSPALRARAHTSLLRTYAPPRVRLGSSPEDFAAAHIAAAAASGFVQSASGAGFAAAGAEGRGVRWSLSGGGGRVREQALVGTPSRPDARAGEGATPGWGIIATPLPAWLGPARIVGAKPVDPTRRRSTKCQRGATRLAHLSSPEAAFWIFPDGSLSPEDRCQCFTHSAAYAAPSRARAIRRREVPE
jgi:hypothetical protein